MDYNCQSETGRIAGVLLKHPRDAFRDQDYIDANWEGLNYTGRPDLQKTVWEFENFVEIIREAGARIYFLPRDADTGLDSVYVHDPALITRKGAILCNMGKAARQGEPAVMGRYLQALGVPVLGEISGAGRLEGGDVVWLDDKTMAVGLGYRTNSEAVRQLREMTAGLVEEVIEVPLPHWNGEEECLHLMSMISPVDKDLAVVYSRMMPVPFRNLLLSRGMKFIEVPDSEYDTMACNVLALAPRHCVMLAGNPVTQRLLAAEGVQVHVYEGTDLSLKGCGGPTCLTRPILRK